MFFYRTTQMPSIQKILELERIIVVDGAGNNVPVSASQGNACLVGEFVQGPFTPTVINNPGDINNLYMNDPSKFSLISQGGFDGAADDQNGAGIAFDGNGWAELKGKSFSGLVIQRVDTDMIVKGDGTSSASRLTWRRYSGYSLRKLRKATKPRRIFLLGSTRSMRNISFRSA